MAGGWDEGLTGPTSACHLSFLGGKENNGIFPFINEIQPEPDPFPGTGIAFLVQGVLITVS